jgi:cyclopropane fatty-acyl-phospholipid synthase-like methyltransferase
MFSHVGKSNYKACFNIIHDLLTVDGLMLFHTTSIYNT